MKLQARVTGLFAAGLYADNKQRIQIHVEGGDTGYKAFIVPNDGLVLDDEVVLLVTPKSDADALYEFLTEATSDYALPPALASLLDQLRPDAPPPFMEQDADRPCVVTCHSYIPRGCDMPHRCTLKQGHAAVHSFAHHEPMPWDDTRYNPAVHAGGAAGMMWADDTGKESIGEYEESRVDPPEPEDDGEVLRPKPTATIWVTREGERIAVRDMDDQHLINTIRMLRRKAPRMMIAEELSLYAYLDSDPPDGAYDCASSALAELDSMDTDEFLESTVLTYAAMLAEAEKRGLMEAINA